jgi:hypothetical protein
MNKHKLVIEQLCRTLGIDAIVTRTNGGHWRIKSSDLNKLVFASASPSDVRALKNLKTDLNGAKK